MESMVLQMGVFHRYFVSPFIWVIHHFAEWLDGSYGLALIAITILVRLLLMPFMINQYKRQQLMKSKMKAMGPEIEAIKQKYAGSKGADSQRKQTEETMALYGRHGYNPLALGCLPMLLQIPLLSGLYYAIRSNPELTHHTFLWFQLGSPDHILPFLAAGVYGVQALITKSTQQPENVQNGMGWLLYLSPILMGIFSFSAPAAIPLYWCVGGIVVIVQTAIAKRLYPLERNVSSSAGTA